MTFTLISARPSPRQAYELGAYKKSDFGISAEDRVLISYAATEALAQQFVVAMAAQGVGAWYRTSEGGEYHDLSPEQVKDFKAEHLEELLRLAMVDQGMLAAAEFRARSDIHYILRDLTEMADLTTNPHFHRRIAEAQELLVEATSDQIVPSEKTTYGYRPATDSEEQERLLSEVAETWGVDPDVFGRESIGEVMSGLTAESVELSSETKERLSEILGDFMSFMQDGSDDEQLDDAPIVA